jgi:GntR family transcriptional regulator
MTGDDAIPRRYDPKGRARVWQAIAGDLAAKIDDGTYPPNGRIPSLDDLMHEYGAARETIRKAVAHLAERQYVDVVPGKGTFSTEPAERLPLQ